MAIGNINNGEIGSSVRSKLNLLINEVNDEVVKLTGTQYIYVKANGTDTENATELQDAYDLAKTMSPSATKRITIIAGMGNYNFGSSIFDMDTQYIDLVSLDGNRSVIFNATLNTIVTATRTQGSINITANDVFVKGVDVLTKNFTIGDNLNLLKVENCKGGDFSFGYERTASGTFTNCVAGTSSFARDGTASGTFTNCVAGTSSFGRSGTASGTFTDCQGSTFSFGNSDTASGTFTNCVASDASFATNGTASGTFTNCVSGVNSFGRSGTASGTFTNCVSGTSSFGSSGTLNGKLYYCRLTAGTFQTPSSGGKIVLGIDGNDDIINL